MRPTIILLFLFLGSAIWAQPGEIHTYPESKSFDPGQAGASCLMPLENNSFLLVTHQENGFLGTPVETPYHLYLTDTNLDIRRHTAITNTAGSALLAHSVHQGKAALMLYNRGKKNDRFTVYQIDTATLKIHTREILSHTLNRRDQSLYWCETSPDGNYTALVSILYIRSTGATTCQTILLDRSLQPIWQKEEPIEAVSDIYVNDQGVIYVAGITSYNQFQGCRITRDDFKQGASDLQQKAYSCRLLNVRNDQMVVGGTFVAPGSKPRHIEFGGYYGLSFDAANGTLSGFHDAPFSPSDHQVLLNSDSVGSSTLQHIGTAFETPTSWGGILALQQFEMNQYADNDGVVTRTYERHGTLIAAIGFDGSILWTRNVPQSISRLNSESLMDGAPFTKPDGLVLIQTESSKNTFTSTGFRKAQPCSPVTGLNSLIQYSLDSQGNLHSVPIQQRSRCAIGTWTQSKDGRLWILESNNGRSRLLYLRP